jgi:cell division protein FtsA
MNHINFETTNNLFLLINFSDNYISATVVEYSDKQQQGSILCYKKQYVDELVNGRVTDINRVSLKLENILMALKKTVNLNLPFESMKTIISISNRTGEIKTSHGILNFLSGKVSSEEIDRVVKAALYNSKIDNEKEQLLNLTVNNFIVDDMSNIKNPMDMSCQCLQANICIESVNKTTIFDNFETILNNNNIVIEHISFDSSAISESILTQDDKEYGTVVVEIKDQISVITLLKNGNVQNYIEVQNMGIQFIVEKIARVYKLSYKTAEWIYLNIDTIIDKTDNQGLFELINANNQILQIELEYLNNIIFEGFQEIFDNIKTEVEQIQIEQYLNGILFVHNFKFSGIEIIFDNIFTDYVKNTRNVEYSENINNNNIFNVELLESDIVIIGMVNKLAHVDTISYNYLNKLIKMEGGLNGNHKPESDGFNLSNVSNVSNKKETFFEKSKKMMKKLW